MRGRSSVHSMIFGIITACCMVGGLRAEGIRHRFVCVDNGTNTLHYIDQLTPENGWSVPIPKGSRDLELVGEGRILVGHGDGAAEYALKDGKRLWQITGFNKVQTARRLRDGNTMLGIDGGPFLVVDREGKIVKEIRMPAGWTSHLRLARVLENGNILYVTGNRVVEADQTGKIVKTLSLAGAGYTANRLGNGHNRRDSDCDAHCRDPGDFRISCVLAAGMMITSDHRAHMSTRNTVSCMGQGQASGTAAAIRAARKCGTRDLRYSDLRDSLIKAGVYLEAWSFSL